MRKWWPDIKWWLAFISLPATGVALGFVLTAHLNDAELGTCQDYKYIAVEQNKELTTRLHQSERMMEMCISTVESSAQETAVCVMKLQHCIGVK